MVDAMAGKMAVQMVFQKEHEKAAKLVSAKAVGLVVCLVLAQVAKMGTDWAERKV